jgi:hypothetical protein
MACAHVVNFLDGDINIIKENRDTGYTSGEFCTEGKA